MKRFPLDFEDQSDSHDTSSINAGSSNNLFDSFVHFPEWDLEQGMRQEILKTFYEHSMDIFAPPDEMGLELPNVDYFEEAALSSMWIDPPRISETDNSSQRPSSQSNFDPFRISRSLKSLSWHVKDLICTRLHTSYKEVADELIDKLGLNSAPIMSREERNVRRRVYDAINVLVAIKIIKKKGKTVNWIGLPRPASHPCQHVQKRLNEKREVLKDLALKILATEGLVRRNSRQKMSAKCFASPFIVVALPRRPHTKMQLWKSLHSTKFVLKVNSELRILGDVDVLAAMGLHFSGSRNIIPEEVLELCNLKM